MGPGVDTGPLGDSAPDTSTLDASDASDGGVNCGLQFQCGNQCVNTCQGCSFGVIACTDQTSRRLCASDCSQCVEGRIACATCAGGAPAGFCTNNVMQCSNAGAACPCESGDAGECPSANQICSGSGPGSQCKTCGTGGTDNKPCGNGLTCTASTATCDRDQ